MFIRCKADITPFLWFTVVHLMDFDENDLRDNVVIIIILVDFLIFCGWCQLETHDDVKC